MKEGLEKHFEEGVTPPEEVKDPVPQAEAQVEATPEQAPAEEVPAEEPTQVVEEPVLETIEEEQETVIEAKEEVAAPESPADLPENIDKLVSFMNDTGGTIEDYVKLNRSYDNFGDRQLLQEYYNQTKPHLDQEDVSFLIDKHVNINTEEMEEVEAREKKIAFKEELSKAKSYLENAKQKYYAELKVSGGRSDRANEEASAKAAALQERFEEQSRNLFNEDFKGFKFDLGEGKKSIRYKVNNPDNVMKQQLDINNVLGGFLDESGNVKSAESYHKALFAMQNSDKIAQLFYEQGVADAVKENSKTSKNIDFSHTHQPPSSSTKLQPGQAREIQQETFEPRIKTRFTKF